MKLPQIFKVYPYKKGSNSAKLLAQTLNGKVLKLENSKYEPRERHIVVNWGNSNERPFGPARVLNHDTTIAGCKLQTFQKLKEDGVSIPEFWTNKEDIPVEAFPVVSRTILNGHSGRGIVIANAPEEAPEAPLYTKYIKKKDEYRVHVVQDRVIFVQRKARRLDVAEPNWLVRNLAGGFVFALAEQEDVPKDVIDQAIKATSSLGLDFGAVDVIWNDHYQKAFVLECNTAPGLEPRSAELYANAFKDL